jgi:hypothetical protein
MDLSSLALTPARSRGVQRALYKVRQIYYL